MNNFPRRSDLQQLTPAERSIYDAMQEVEKLPGDVRLTNAVIDLQKARDWVADYVDDVKRQEIAPSVDEKALVSFGNYLLKTYGVMVHSNEGQNVPLYQRGVSDADLSNWQVGWEIENKKLPSRFQNGDKVEVNFGDAGRVGNCEIIKVHFTESKVLYDVKTSWKLEESGKAETRFYNVDSAFVEPAENS